MNHSTADNLPYWRLSGFYLFYFAVLGALIPYWGLYLKSLGYSAQEIGAMGAVIMGTKIVAPNLWGWLADRRGRRLGIIRLGSGLACVCFLGVFVAQQFAWLLLVVACYTFFWNAVLAQFEVVTLGHLGEGYGRYSHIRVWGSVGFILTVIGLGRVFDVVDIAHLPVFISAFLLLIWLSTLSVGERLRDEPLPHPGGLRQLLLQRPVWCFFLACFLLQLSHGPYYTFYSLHLVENHGYSRSATGLLWALGVLAEVLVFLVMHRFLHRFGLRRLLLWALLVTALRWWLIGTFAGQLSALLFAQLLHAGSFAVAHAVCIEWIRRHFAGAHQGQGQALYSALSFGAGGALGALLSGLLWDWHAGLTFTLAGAAALLAFVVVWWGVSERQSAPR